jgi:hypothetical protein
LEEAARVLLDGGPGEAAGKPRPVGAAPHLDGEEGRRRRRLFLRWRQRLFLRRRRRQRLGDTGEHVRAGKQVGPSSPRVLHSLRSDFSRALLSLRAPNSPVL